MRSWLAVRILAAFVAVMALAAPALADGEWQETQPQGRSGFWTSSAPATNGAYRWRLLAIGVGLVIVTGVTAIVVVKRVSKKSTRDAAWAARRPDLKRD